MYLTDKQVAARFNVSRQCIWRWVKAKNFPRPYSLSPGCTRWKLSDIEGWEPNRVHAAAA
jgi:prophage regulatory protein